MLVIYIDAFPMFGYIYKEVGDRFRKSQVRAVAKVNEESLRFNWSVGRDIVLKGFTNIYGSGFFVKFSKDMKKQFPEIKSFSVANLHYMKWYYELYSAENNLPQPGIDSMELIFRIPWGHNKLIIDKCKNNQEKTDSDTLINSVRPDLFL